MKLWSGRIGGRLDGQAAQLNSSLTFDRRLARVDVAGSLAWAGALKRAGVITPDECGRITTGLEAVREEFEEDRFVFHESDEDIHTAVERRLTEIIGETAGKLHTGRSRNDQVATDFRLWLLTEAAPSIDSQILGLQQALINRAEQDSLIVMPGYTHFQQAQPVLMSHWWLSHFWALQRDRQRLQNVLIEAESMPLGSGALAGTGYPIDRFALAADLEFREPAANSLDAVSDRDFAVDFLYCLTLTAVHLSRLAEALILYSTSEFGFVILADEYSTGSSLMPQKKNPDPLELTRAKSGVIIGRLAGLLSTLKALPSAYDKDLQEDKPAVFEAADMVGLILPVMAGVITTLKVDGEKTRQAVHWQSMATDLADYLVGKGVAFRQAHNLVGQAVARAEALGIELPEMPLASWRRISPVFEADLFETFDIDHSLSLRGAYGGTAPKAVKVQLEEAQRLLSQESERRGAG